jgi:hypothetical protein
VQLKGVPGFIQVGSPPHIHHTQEETFYILQGEMEFVTNDITTRAPSGSLVRIPRGYWETTGTWGPEHARVLVLFASGGFEGFFEEVLGDNINFDLLLVSVSANTGSEVDTDALASKRARHVTDEAHGAVAAKLLQLLTSDASCQGEESPLAESRRAYYDRTSLSPDPSSCET